MAKAAAPTVLPRARTHPGTRRALRRYRLGSLGLIGVGLARFILFVIVIGVTAGAPNRVESTVASVFGGGGLVAICGGVLALLNSLRMSWTLARHPWTIWQARYRNVPVFAGGQPTVVLTGADAEPLVLCLVAFKWRWHHVADTVEHHGTAWFAGDPSHGGVIAAVGGTHLIWTRRPRLTWWRRRLLAEFNPSD